jgi:gluconolactonase
MKTFPRFCRFLFVSLALPALAVAGGACSSGGDSGSGGRATGGTATGGAATGGATGGSNTGGASSGGSSTGGSASGGAHTGGGNNTGGSASGGNASGGNASGGNASGGAAGGSGTGGAGGSGTGGGTSNAKCPAGPFPALQLPSAMPTRIDGAPPSDTFNQSGNGFTNIEGPVWIENALYVSEIGSGNNPPMSRILKITSSDAVSIAVADSGSNGLAVDAGGNIVSANHGVGGIVRINPATGAKTTLIDNYNGKRFDSPNDLTIRSDGGIFFTDPNFQAPNPNPQPTTGVYFLPAGGNMAKLLLMNLSNPNGITLSLDEKTIYIGDGSGVHSYPVSADGTLGTGTAFGNGLSGGTDGMVVDCAGNVYVVRGDAHNVSVYDPTGKMIGNPITTPGNGQITNVAFGGADHKTLYLTAMGTGTMRGVFKLTGMPIPGLPY